MGALAKASILGDGRVQAGSVFPCLSFSTTLELRTLRLLVLHAHVGRAPLRIRSLGGVTPNVQILLPGGKGIIKPLTIDLPA